MARRQEQVEIQPVPVQGAKGKGGVAKLCPSASPPTRVNKRRAGTEAGQSSRNRSATGPATNTGGGKVPIQAGDIVIYKNSK